MHQRHIPTAREVMTRALVTLRPETPIFEAIRALLDNDISGAPVIDRDGKLVGLFSEFDALRLIAAGELYEHGHYATATVSDLMTDMIHTIAPGLDLYGIAHAFVVHRVRRLPVVEHGRLVGQVSRRDVLRAIERSRRARKGQKKYPDYPLDRQPRE